MPSTTPPPTGLTVAGHLEPYEVPPANFSEYFVEGPDANSKARLVASAAVIHSGRVLLLQRAPHGFQALLWELPGGRCESYDETVIASAARELWEESGLVANRVIDVVGEYEWLDREAPWKKITFLMTVEHGDQIGQQPQVKIDPEEQHSFIWATENDVITNQCNGISLSWTSDQQKQTVLDAFKLLK